MLHIIMNERFIKLWDRLGIEGSPASEYQFLLGSYTSLDRYYHNLSHIEACLNDFQEVSSLAKNPELIEFAIWYHDVVYDVNRTDNEEQSANRALAVCLKFRLPQEWSREIKELILATGHDATPKTNSQKIITDVDLAILGKPECQYGVYEKAIRKEYCHIPEEVFQSGRIRILQAFLSRPFIYSLPYFKDKYEAQARRNIEKAISCLSSQPG